ncbi:hypothetical protein AB0F11_18385 [Streptomyces sp. NPDC032472]|uniref:hypothetical protein n=1 Tax=Streptomyces sp. NPDC032472 TaxID=3155018 RepID=UPI0033C4997E
MRGFADDLVVNAPYGVVAISLAFIAWMIYSAYTLKIALCGSQPPERPAIIREHAKMIRFWRRRS